MSVVIIMVDVNRSVVILLVLICVNAIRDSNLLRTEKIVQVT